MTFKKKMKKIGNETLCKYSKNPYLIQKNEEKKRLPIWAKITIPSSLITIGVVLTIALTTAFSGKVIYKDHVIAYANKTFNNEYQPISNEYLEIYNKLTVDLYNTFYKDYFEYPLSRNKGTSNIILSPITISNQLYMIYDILKSNNKEELGKIIYINNNLNYKEDIKKSILNNIIDHTYNNAHIYIDLAQALFVEDREKYNLKEDFIKEITDYYLFDIFYGDFDTSTGWQMIIDYVDEKTFNLFNPNHITAEERIEHLKTLAINGAPGGMSGDIHLYNINYLSSNWGLDFSYTSKLNNFVNYDMSTTSNIKYIQDNYHGEICEEDDFYIIKVPLLDKYTFNILLPKEGMNYYTVINKNINSLININNNTFTSKQIELALPEFEVESSSFLWRITGLMNNYFWENPLFSSEGMGNNNISNNDYAKLGSSYIFSKLSVNKDGIVASSFTDSSQHAIPASATPIPRPDIVIDVDHPFAYSITDPKGMSLFVGQVTKL